MCHKNGYVIVNSFPSHRTRISCSAQLDNRDLENKLTVMLLPKLPCMLSVFRPPCSARRSDFGEREIPQVSLISRLRTERPRGFCAVSEYHARVTCPYVHPDSIIPQRTAFDYGCIPIASHTSLHRIVYALHRNQHRVSYHAILVAARTRLAAPACTTHGGRARTHTHAHTKYMPHTRCV